VTPDPASPRDDPRALIRYALISLTVTVILVWTAYLVRGPLMLIYVSALLAIGLAPLVAVVERQRLIPGHRLPRWAAILIIYLLFLTVIISFGRLVIGPLLTQARDLWAAFPNMLHDWQQWFIERGLLTKELSLREAIAQSPFGGSDAIDTIVSAVWGFVGGIFGLVTILILAFYLLVDAETLVHTFVRLFPRTERPRVERACRQVSGKVSAWLGGQLLLGGIIACSAALGLYLLGVPFFYVLALIAGIGEMIPIVGPLLAAVPAVAVGFTISPAKALAIAAFFFVQQQVENHVLVPKVMERQVGINAAGVITALLIGGTLLGVVGAILAVPTAAILRVIFEELFPEASAD
jgi:predicted PurR-regulated permease PerM